VMGDQREETCLELGRALARCTGGKKVLFIASSDLSHFYPSHLAKRKDANTMNAIMAMDEDELLQSWTTETLKRAVAAPSPQS